MRYFLMFILTLITVETFPQSKVSGVTFDNDGSKLPFVTIQEVGTVNNVVSDLDGSFHILTTKDECTLEFLFIGYVPKSVKIIQDTTLNVVMQEDCTGCCNCPSRRTIGINYEAINSMFGLAFSNGYDEMPLIHFEDFADRVIFKMNVQTNFSKDYSFGANVGLKYPFRFLSIISAGYSQYDYQSEDFFYRDIHISAGKYLRNTELTLKTGYQVLNDYHNWGVALGLQKNVVYSKLLVGFSAGYYFDYLNFSAYLQGIINKNFSYRLGYDRVDKYNFCNFGLNYIWNK